jgi:7-cyano-7-deazaguanine reductase
MAQAGNTHLQAGAPQFANPDGGLEGGNGGFAMGAGVRESSPAAEAPVGRLDAAGGIAAAGATTASDAVAAAAAGATITSGATTAAGATTPSGATSAAAATAAPATPAPTLPGAANSAAPSPTTSELPPASAAPSAPSAPGERTRTPAYGERMIEEAELLCFANPRPGRPFEISIKLPEFTCKCPFSGYPDFAVLGLLYQPGPRVLELKAIKLYVNRYRDRSISHEEVANRILDDLVEACDPVWMELTADFNPRGNVHTVVRVSHGTRQPC